MYSHEFASSNHYEARKKLIARIDNPKRKYHANCLVSATYMSNEMQKLGIPHNILLFLKYFEFGSMDYNGVILYKYKDELLVCDILANCTFTSSTGAFLAAPYDEYKEYYAARTGEEINNERILLFDDDLTSQKTTLEYIVLSEWNVEKLGFFTSKKNRRATTQLREVYYYKKFNNGELPSKRKSKIQNCPN